MHPVVMESLEEYLSGSLERAAQREIEAHLSTCQMCREEVQGMREVSRMFGSLRSEEIWEKSPSFFAGVMQQVREQETRPAFAGWFGLDLAFGRRLAFASLMTMAVLGSWLVSREARAPEGPSPAAIMAQQNSPEFDSASAQDNMLVTLTAYEH